MSSMQRTPAAAVCVALAVCFSTAAATKVLPAVSAEEAGGGSWLLDNLVQPSGRRLAAGEDRGKCSVCTEANIYHGDCGVFQTRSDCWFEIEHVNKELSGSYCCAKSDSACCIENTSLLVGVSAGAALLFTTGLLVLLAFCIFHRRCVCIPCNVHAKPRRDEYAPDANLADIQGAGAVLEARQEQAGSSQRGASAQAGPSRERRTDTSSTADVENAPVIIGHKSKKAYFFAKAREAERSDGSRKARQQAERSDGSRKAQQGERSDGSRTGSPAQNALQV